MAAPTKRAKNAIGEVFDAPDFPVTFSNQEW